MSVDRVRPRMLILLQYYLPGYKSGGPVRSMEGLGIHLGDEWRILLAAYDRDSSDRHPYPELAAGERRYFGEVEVAYVPKTARRWVAMWGLLRRESRDLLYVQSLFNPCFTLWPLLLRRLRLVPGGPVLLAPRGELAAGALGLKSGRKRFFLRMARALRLFRGVHWQASSEAEAEEILRSGLADGGAVHVARNLRVIPPMPEGNCYGEEAADAPLRLVFVSRIAPKKRLDGALRILQRLRVPVVFDIHGPVDRDKEHWAECQRLMEDLPEHVSAVWHGPSEPGKIPGIFARADGFLFPTLGENFGHVIAESLLAGCPVLLSDQTPWNGLEQAGCGVNLEPDDFNGFARAIERLAGKSMEERLLVRERARQRGIEGLGVEEAVEAHRRMFTSVLGGPAQRPHHG